MAAHVPKATAGIDRHLADADIFGRQLHDPHLFRGRIEPHNSIGVDFVGPDDAGPVDVYRVRSGVACGQRIDFHDFSGRRIDFCQLAVAVLRDPQHAVGRGSDPGPVEISVIWPDLGSSRPTLLSPMRQNQTLPALSSARPYGPPDVGYSVIGPLVLGSKRPILLPLCMVNQITPSLPITSVC